MLYKTLPRDIDDLSSVLFEETEETAIAYRSSDPGVLELCTSHVMEVSATHTRKPKRNRHEMDARVEDPSSVPGEWAIQMYHEVHWNQRQRQDQCNTKKRIISIRVGSTSSRASIFDSSSQAPLFLVAFYPRQLHEGTKRHGLEAYNYGMDLGSYNCRLLPPKESVLLSDTPSSKHRFLVGRSRIIWSEKERPEAKSQRCAYRSVLNGQRLDTSSLKRPLQVKVGIRINMVLLSYSGSRSNPAEASAVTYQNKKSMESSSNSYSRKVIHDSLNFACGQIETSTSQRRTVEESDAISHDYSQCTLNVEKYVADKAGAYLSCRADSNSMVRAEAASDVPFTIERFVDADSSLSETNQGDHVFLRLKVNKTGMQTSAKPRSENPVSTTFNRNLGRRLHAQLQIVSPRLELLPTEDGQIRVTCTISGTIKHDTKDVNATAGVLETTNGQPRRIPSVMLRVLAVEVGRCVICWNSISKEKSYVCQGCHVSAHSTCVNFTTERSIDHDDWLCSSCIIIGEDRICGVCHFPEGILLPWKENQWIHNVCRTWCGIDETAKLMTEGMANKDSSIGTGCHLCSKQNTPVVVCMGEGCSVRFHPMCALVASMAQEIRCLKLNEPPPQYTLTMIRTTFSSEGKTVDSKVLPVAFCPHHGPVQCCHPTFDSCTVRIPPRRQQKLNP
jgi:PHD-zinc-finger like domain